MRNHYCCCMIVGEKDGKYIFTLDVQTFPNPKKDPTAKKKCAERAKLLREELKTRGTPLYKHFTALFGTTGRFTRVEPMEHIGIEEE